jgi:hypothetical protein
MPMFPANTKSTSAPERTALQPNTSWKSSGSRKGTVATATQKAVPPDTEARKDITRSVPRSISGSSDRSRWRTASPSSSTDAAPNATVRLHAPPDVDSRCPVYVRVPRPADVQITPRQSSTPVPAAAPPLISRQVTAKATTPSGRLIRKSHRQLVYVDTTPPTSGATTGASSAGHTMYDTIRGMSGLAAPESATSRPTGTIIAPPAPCTTRSATRVPRSGAAAHATEASVNRAIALSRTRRAP